MKKTGWKDLISNIGRTRVSFLSVMIFVMLATAIFLGIDWSAKGFKDTVGATMEAGQMHDAEITHPYGLTDAFLDEIRAEDGVSTVAGRYFTERILKQDRMSFRVRIESLNGEIDLPSSCEGRLPEAEDEIAVEKFWADTNGIRPGEEIRFERGDTDDLQTETFKVTGLVYSPLYLSQYRDTYGVSVNTGTPYDAIMFVPDGTFVKDEFPGYPSAVIRFDSLRAYPTFSEDYKTESGRMTKRLEERLAAYSEQRNRELQQMYPFAHLESYDGSVLGRDNNAGVTASLVPGAIMTKIKYTLSVLFVLIGIFVCYSAISRIVYEQSVLIGTKKALGFRKREVRLFYIAYVFAAVLVGSILGNFVARFLIEPVILKILADNINITGTVFRYDAGEALVFFAFEMIVTLLFAFLACNRTLNRGTSALLAGDEETRAKRHAIEKSVLWQKLSLLGKTIVNNCLNDKRRVFATLVGIIGCCSLIACSLTMFANLNASRKCQEEEICTYDTMICLDTGRKKAAQNVGKVLEENGISYANTYFTTVYLRTDDGYTSAALFSFEDDAFREFFHVMTDGLETLPTGGLWVCKAYADDQKLSAGVPFELIDGTGNTVRAETGGVFDFYLSRAYLLADRETYGNLFGQAYTTNTIILNRGARSAEEIHTLLEGTKGFLSVTDCKEEADQLFDALNGSMMMVVATFFVLSVALAFMVLLNLLFMFVSEKKKELIVMMINGFSRKEARRYITCDTAFLTVIGIVLGTVLGVTVGFLTLKLLSSECVTIMRKVSLPACLACAAFTALLSGISCGIAMRRVRGFKLSDINTL